MRESLLSEREAGAVVVDQVPPQKMPFGALPQTAGDGWC